MAILNFPPTAGEPTDGSFTYEDNGVLYSWDGYKWEANSESGFDSVYVEVDGDNMTGDLTLGGDKIQLNAADGSADFATDIDCGDIQSAGKGAELIGSLGICQVRNDSGTSVNTAFSALVGDYNSDSTVFRVTYDGDVQSLSQNGGQLAGFRNQIINGDFRIWQRGTAGYLNPSSTNKYASVDRWCIQSLASGNHLARSSSTPEGFTYSATIDGVTNASIRHYIELYEGQAGPFIAGSTWTLSVWADKQVRGRVLDSSTTFTGMSDMTATSEVSNGFTRYVKTFTISSTASEKIEVALQNQTMSLMRVTGCQLEPGPAATPFEHRPIGIELALCQRYFINIGTVDQLANYRPPERGIQMPFPTTMRTTPTYSYTKYYQYIGKSWAEYTGAGIGVTRNTHGFVFTQDNSNSSVPIIVTEVTADAEL